MQLFRPPPMNGAPVAPGDGGSIPSYGLAPPGGMRGPPPRGPPPMGFPPQGMMMMMRPRSPLPVPSGNNDAPIVALQDMGSINLFVGKLPKDVNDIHVRNLLEKCGNVVSWKRTLDPVTSKPKSFGYCTYAGAMDARRALRLLSGFSIDSKQIVMKADNKIQAKIDAYTASMSEALKREEQEQDEELRCELKRLEEERRGLKGGIQHGPDISVDLLDTRSDKTSMEEQDASETPATTQGSASDDQGAPAEAQVQQKTILSEIEKFRLAQDQRERELHQKRRHAVLEHLRQEKEEQERIKEADGAKVELVSVPIEPPVEIIPEPENTGSAKDEPSAEVTEKTVSLEMANGDKQELKDDTKSKSRDRVRTREREKRRRDRDRRKRVRSRSRSHSRERSSRRRRRSRSFSRSRSRDRGRESRRDRKRSRESDRRRSRRRNSSAVDEEMESERRSKRRRTSRSNDVEPASPVTEVAAVVAPKPVVKVVMDLKMSLSAPKKEKNLPGPAPSLFKVEEEIEVKPVRDFVKIDFAEEERQETALAQQKAAETAAKINRRTEDVKTLIDSIPTGKAGLFAFPVDWVAVERHHVVKDKMLPWVTKKVVEYLGEEDATLISFILKKLAAKATPHEILDELQAILEDEAEVFVKSLWRKLAFEALRAAA